MNEGKTNVVTKWTHIAVLHFLSQQQMPDGVVTDACGRQHRAGARLLLMRASSCFSRSLLAFFGSSTVTVCCTRLTRVCRRSSAAVSRRCALLVRLAGRTAMRFVSCACPCARVECGWHSRDHAAQTLLCRRGSYAAMTHSDRIMDSTYNSTG